MMEATIIAPRIALALNINSFQSSLCRTGCGINGWELKAEAGKRQWGSEVMQSYFAVGHAVRGWASIGLSQRSPSTGGS